MSPGETKEKLLGLALGHQRIEGRPDVLVALTVPEGRNWLTAGCFGINQS
jgi:hypothetical protein